MADLTMPDLPYALDVLSQEMGGQEHVGAVGGLVVRLARFLGGDPITSFLVTSANPGAPAFLPDSPGALSATFVVQGNPISYTLDTSAPVNGTSPSLPVGTVITLTGLPSIKAFQFASTQFGNASVNGVFYT